MSKKISSLPLYSGVLPDISYVPIVVDGTTYKYKLPEITDATESSITSLYGSLGEKQDDISQLGYIKFSSYSPSFSSSDSFIWVEGTNLFFKNSAGNTFTIDLTSV